MKKGKNALSTLGLVAISLVGMAILLYPIVSDYWNSLIMKEKISQYDSKINQLDAKTCDEIFEKAIQYNKRLAAREGVQELTDEQKLDYYSLLSVDDTGMIGFVEIPSIDVELPIYHGTSEEVLKKAVGHLEWSSLPTGGESTHSAFSGHRGLPTSMLFTDLAKLQEGDIFLYHILNRVFTYEVDQIVTVKPEDVTEMGIVQGMDYSTLVTCTPYGVNTHRLLVRGHRIENALAIHITNEATEISSMLVALFLGIFFVTMILVVLFLYDKSRKSTEQKKYVPRHCASR